jgi:hypothetical protein
MVIEAPFYQVGNAIPGEETGGIPLRDAHQDDQLRKSGAKATERSLVAALARDDQIEQRRDKHKDENH